MALTLKKISILSNALDIQALKKATSSKEEVKLIAEQLQKVVATLSVDDTSLDTLKEIVDFIKANKETIDALNVDKIIGLKDALDAKLDQVTYTAGTAELKASIASVVKTLETTKAELEGKITAVKTEIEKTVADNKTALEASVKKVADDLAKTDASVTELEKKVKENTETAKTELTKNIEVNKAEIKKVADENVKQAAKAEKITEAIKTNEKTITENFNSITRNVSGIVGSLDQKIQNTAKDILDINEKMYEKTTELIQKACNDTYNRTAEAVIANTIGTGKEHIPNFDTATSKEGDIVLDANGNLCIVETAKEGEETTVALDSKYAMKKITESYEGVSVDATVPSDIKNSRTNVEGNMQPSMPLPMVKPIGASTSIETE